MPPPTLDVLFPPVPMLPTGLPDPSGTPKQIEWARMIRARKWAGLPKAGMKARYGEDPAKVAEAEAAIRWLGGRASAAWWIDRRTLGPVKLWRAVLADPEFRERLGRLAGPGQAGG